MRNKQFLNQLLAIAVLSLAGSANAEQQLQYEIGGAAISQEAYQAIEKGQQLLHSNNNADAIEMLKKAISLAPNVPDIHNNLGIALAKTGQSDAAIQEFELARKLNPGLDAPWISLGGMYQSTGQIGKAIEAYKGFLQRFPTHRDATKISSLVQGLEKEYAREKAFQASTGNAEPTNDYLRDVTQQGTIRWSAQKMPLKVFIAPGTGVPNYVPEMGETLKKSFADWAQVSGGLLSFALVDSPQKADIECSWTNDPTRFKNIAEAGETLLFSNKSGLVKGKVTFLTVPLVAELPLTINRMRSICLHEVGHVIGMAGHTSNPQDAMFHTMAVADQWRDLAQRDANTVVRLYSQPLATQTAAPGAPAPGPR